MSRGAQGSHELQGFNLVHLKQTSVRAPTKARERRQGGWRQAAGGTVAAGLTLLTEIGVFEGLLEARL